ncbi:MAG: GNAT family N-acetyltransferase [Anaerolineae bacterium]|nr:GNAT family N-acetyltransferase [Anaerolineae bacterium]
MTYTNSLDGITPDRLHDFFVGWPDPPTPQTHLNLLHGSAHVWLAVDSATGAVVGFITALSDGVLAAFIPLLEVLPEYQGRGIGTELMWRMIKTLRDLYALDLTCDTNLQAFYTRFGMRPIMAMALRRYEQQSGRNIDTQ